MMTTLVLPYKSGSESAKALADSLNCKRMRLLDSKVKDNPELVIVNWGNSTQDLSHLHFAKILNKPDNVRLASHKLEFFRKIEHENKDAFVTVNIPDWTTDPEVAKDWYTEGNDVVIRNTLQGHSGDGIDLIRYNLDKNANSVIYNAPLYTKYMKKRDEYRVHVMRGVPILIQRKGIRSSASPETYQIRNTANGFIYLLSDVKPEGDVLSQAVNAVNVLGLDFGAVDVIWNEHKKLATVLEVNTACGLKGDTTLAKYKTGFKRLLNNEEIPDWKTPTTSRDAETILKRQLLMYPYEELDVCEGDTVYVTEALQELFAEFSARGGTDRGIDLWMHAEHHGLSGYFWIYWVNHNTGEAQLSYTDEEDNDGVIKFNVPLHLIEHMG